jgi:hypothetical protein
VAGLTPEQYERWGPGLQEFGLSLAETREAHREVRRARQIYNQVLEDLDRAEERMHNAFRLWEDAE